MPVIIIKKNSDGVSAFLCFETCRENNAGTKQSFLAFFIIFEELLWHFNS